MLICTTSDTNWCRASFHCLTELLWLFKSVDCTKQKMRLLFLVQLCLRGCSEHIGSKLLGGKCSQIVQRVIEDQGVNLTELSWNDLPALHGVVSTLVLCESRELRDRRVPWMKDSLNIFTLIMGRGQDDWWFLIVCVYLFVSILKLGEIPKELLYHSVPKPKCVVYTQIFLIRLTSNCRCHIHLPLYSTGCVVS